MSKYSVAALAGAAVVACHGAAMAQEKPAAPVAAPAAPAVAPAPAAKTTLPPVVVEQKKKPEVDIAKPVAKPKKAPMAVEDAPLPKPKPAKKAVAQPAPASAAQPEPGTPPAQDTLNVDGREVPTVIDGRPVQRTSAGPVDGYRALTQSTATLSGTAVERTPQSIAVIPGTVLQDQATNYTTDALRNVSAVVPRSSLQTPAFDGTIVRGFKDDYTRSWVDGLPVSYGAGDLDSAINIERIEVLKGPTGMLYGGGVGNPIGGVVNYVTKVPEATPFGRFGITLGSHGYAREFFDVNQPVNPFVSVRLNGDYLATRSNIDVLERDSWNINPSVRFDNHNGTILTVQARFSRYKQQDYQGLPAWGTIAGDFRIRPELFIGPSDIPRSFSKYDGVTVTFDQRLDNVWSLNFKARASQSSFQENAQAIFSETPDAAVFGLPADQWLLFNTVLHQEEKELYVTGHALGRFKAGDVPSKVLVGADYGRHKDEGYIKFAFAGASDLKGDPAFPSWSYPYGGPNDLFVDTTTAGVWAQYEASIWDRLHLVGNVRLANVDQTYDKTTPGALGHSEINETRVLPRIGGVIDLTSSVSLFAGYSESMRAQPFVIYAPGAEPKAELNHQIEGGLKFNFSDQLTGTVAVYQIDRENVTTSMGVGSAATGQQKSRGVDVDAIWQMGAGWKALASYAFVDAKFVTAIPAYGYLAGNTLGGVPEHSGRLWLNYSFQSPMLKGFSAGAGIYASAGKFVDGTNTFKTDGFYTVDAKLAYDAKSYEAAISVKNLTDNRYFDRYGYFDGRVYQPAGVSVFGTLVYKY